MKRNLKQTRENLKYWANLWDRKDPAIVNIIYMLYKNNLTALKNDDDFLIIYDNMEFADLVDSENLSESDGLPIFKKLKKSIKNENDVVLLSYYGIDEKDHGHYKECYFKLKKDYNVIF